MIKRSNHYKLPQNNWRLKRVFHPCVRAFYLSVPLSILLTAPESQAQVIGTTTGYYSDNFDQHGDSPANGTKWLTPAQTGGSSYYASGSKLAGDNGRMSGPWERANRPLGFASQNATPFLMFWTDDSAPAVGSTRAARTYYSFQIAVEPNSKYRLTYRYGLLNTLAPPILQTWANNLQLAAPAAASYNAWQTASYDWSSNANATLTVDLVNDNNSRSGNDFALDDVLLVKLADLAVTKSDGVSSVTRFTDTTYEVAVSNIGESPVAGAILRDPAVAGLTVNSVACAPVPGNLCATPPTIAQLQSGFALPNVPVGSRYALRIGTTVTTLGATIVNTATIAMPSGVVDTNTANNSASDSNAVVTPSADLAISKTSSPAFVTSGGAAAYTVTVTNNGPAAVSGAVLRDPAAAGLSKTAVACSPTPGACAAGATPSIAQLESAAGYALPALAVGQSYQIAISATVTASSGSPVNTATIAAPAGVQDPNTADNSGAASLTVLQNADLRVTKTASQTSPLMGEPMSFTVTARNASPVDVHQVVLRDVLPAGYRLLTATPGQGSYVAGTGLWTIPQLNAGLSASLVVTAVPLGAGPWTNVAELMSMQSANGNPLSGVGATPGNGDPAEPDQAQVVVTPRQGYVPGRPEVCPAGEVALDWGPPGAFDGSTTRQLELAGVSGGMEVFASSASPGWPRVRNTGAGGTPALEVQGTNRVELRIFFDEPFEGMRLAVRGLGANADGLERLRVSAWRDGYRIPAGLTANGDSISLVDDSAVGVATPGGDAGALWIAVDQPASEIRLVMDAVYGSPNALWSLIVGQMTACAPHASISLSPNHDSTVPPGQLAIYPHRLLVPKGLAGAYLNFNIQSDQGLSWILYKDDGDGLFDGQKDLRWENSSSISAGAHDFWLVSRLASDLPAGWRDRTVLRAAAERGMISATSQVVDVTRVGGGLEGQIYARKTVALDADCDGTPDVGAPFLTELPVARGVCVVYRVTFENRSVVPIQQVRVQDHTPDWTTYKGGSELVVHSPVGLSPLPPQLPPDGREGAVAFPFHGALQPGENGVVQFGVRLPGIRNPDDDGAPPN